MGKHDELNVSPTDLIIEKLHNDKDHSPMNADAFRQFYEYHVAENHKLWNYITSLSDDQFDQAIDYSRGSIRNQVVHIMSADEEWFGALQSGEATQALDPADFPDRYSIRVHWDGVEHMMRQYLGKLRDDMLFERPFANLEGDDSNLILWQVLLHCVNHGTDHRAQLLRLLHDMGVKTTSQDFIFYVFDHMPK